MPKSNVVEMKSFKEKRQAFLIKLEEPTKPKQEREPKEEIQVIDINRKSYKAKKSARENSKEEERRAIRRRVFKSAGVLAAVTVASAILGATGASKAYDKYVEDRKSVTLEQTLRKGKTAQDLAISEKTLENIELMDEMLQKGLTYEEMLEVSEKFPNIQKRMLKEKIAMAMGVKAEAIKLRAPMDDIGTHVVIEGKGCFEAKNPINQIKGKSVSEDVINYIEEIIEAQGIEEDFKANKIGMEEAKAFYQKASKKMNQVAAWKITADEKENIGVEKISQLELEMDDDEER